MRHALEASEASVAPFRSVGSDDTAVFVEGVSIGGKHCRHGERVVLRQFQADARVEVAPGARFCCHVIGERAIELVDDADFSFASCVAVALHLHFHVV